MGNRIYGIDLGTTYSCIARVNEAGRPEVMPNKEGDMTTPSVVWFETASNTVVGKTAKENADLYPDQVLALVKRSMGRTVKGSGGADEPFRFAQIHGTAYTPQEVSAMILRKLAEDAREVAGEEIKDVVITCPAYFGENERQATKQAGQIAGLNVRAIINEPTAAAFAYGIAAAKDETVLVYDLGGGTFDVTVITITGGSPRVIATDGDHQLGGADWDKRLVDFFASKFEAEFGVSAADLTADKETNAELRKSAEKVKVKLSTAEATREKVSHNGQGVVVEVTRDQFDQLTRDLLERTATLTDKVMAFAAGEKKVTRVDRVLLVGGSTKMPQAERRVKEMFKNVPVERKDPDQIVAKGAALFALREQVVDEVEHLLGPTGAIPTAPAAKAEFDARLKVLAAATSVPAADLARLARTDVTNVTSKSFGILAMVDDRGTMRLFNDIHFGDALPATPPVNTDYCIPSENSTGIDVAVMESNVPKSEYEATRGKGLDPVRGKEIGRLQVTFPAPLPRGTPIHVQFVMDREQLLVVTAVEPRTGSTARAEIRTGARMSDADLNKAQAAVARISVS